MQIVSFYLFFFFKEKVFEHAQRTCLEFSVCIYIYIYMTSSFIILYNFGSRSQPLKKDF